MASNFPSSLDNSTTLPVEAANTPLSTNHIISHQNIQDALEAVEAKVGVDSSAVTTSHDYKLSLVTTTDKALPRDAAATTTNKILGTGTAITLGSDAEGDTYYRTSGNVLARLPRGSDNQILKMNGNVPNWEAETVTVDATSTTAGIVELATAAEITAGTATGGDGPLVVTPDQLAASTPVFNGSGLTGIVTSGTASASISGSGVSTTQNIDTAVTMSGTAKTIIVDFWLKGFSGAGSVTYSIGTAIFDGTTCRAYFSPLYQSTSTTISATTYAAGNSSPQAGDAGASNGTWTMSIQSLTSTGFTFRLTYTQGSTFNGGDYKCTVMAVK